MGDKLQELVGRQIAKFRKAAGLTQEQLADKLSVALETVSRMERGVNTPSIKTLGRIGDALNVPARDFFPTETDACVFQQGIQTRSLLAGLFTADTFILIYLYDLPPTSFSHCLQFQ